MANVVPIESPNSDDLGPAMLALDDKRRRFVVGWVRNRGKNAAAVARASGFSDKSEGAKVQAFRLLRQPKILAALKEEAERQLDATAALAILHLGGLVEHKDPKVQQAAIDSVLDRKGFGRRTTQDIRVEHVDTRSTAELLAEVRRLTGGALALPVIETTAEDVVHDQA